MVDRAAPRVIGATLTGGPYDLLHELAASPDAHRRRTAMTAPLWFVKNGDDTDVEAGIAIAAVLQDDPDPLVHKPVGIYLAYAGERLPERLPSSSTSTAKCCRARRTASRYASEGEQWTSADRACR